MKRGLQLAKGLAAREGASSKISQRAASDNLPPGPAEIVSLLLCSPLQQRQTQASTTSGPQPRLCCLCHSMCGRGMLVHQFCEALLVASNLCEAAHGARR